MSTKRALRAILILTTMLLSRPCIAAEATPPTDYELIEASEGYVELRVNARGSLRPRNRVTVPAPISGKVAWIIEEGTRVQAGQEIARVDSTEYVEYLAQQKLELTMGEAELRRAKLEAQLVKKQLTFEVQKAELIAGRAQLKHASLGPPTKIDVALSKLTVDQTRFAMEAVEREWERFRKLGESGIESGRTVALARLKFERARADHLKVAADDRLLLKGDAQEDIDVAFQQAEREKTALRLARERLIGEVAYQVTQVEVARVAVDRTRELIKLQQGRVDRSRVVSPVDGIVYYPRYWGRALRPGDAVWQSNRFVDVAGSSLMTVESTVSQADWPRVKPGQDVEVRMVAYPDSIYHGKVRRVGRLARDRSLILREEPANVMSFRLLVDITEESSELRASYTAKLSVITHRLEKALAVPRRALVRLTSGVAVWVMTDNGPVLRNVTMGPSDARRAVIEDGLAPGETVLVPRESSAEQP